MVFLQLAGAAAEAKEVSGIGGGDWIGFLAELLGASLTAGIAVALWYAERNRERRREAEAQRRHFNAQKQWLAIELEASAAGLAAEAERVRQLRLSIDAFCDFATGQENSGKELEAIDGFGEVRGEIVQFIAFAHEPVRQLPALEKEHVTWFGPDFCVSFARLREQSEAFRGARRTIAAPPVSEEELHTLRATLHALANAGNRIINDFEHLTQQLGVKIHDSL